MSNHTLLGIIAFLLFAISGIGLYAAVKNPGSVAALPAEATSAVVAVLPVSEVQADTGANTVSQSATPAPSAQTTQTASSGGYTMAQVATHNSASSCYTAINGSVYDLTSFIYKHPGGPGAILSLCGTDGTAAFMAQHGGQGRPERELATLKIGTLQ